jgi:hypothetical protein
MLQSIKELQSAIDRVRNLHVADYDNACQVCIKGLDYDEYLPVYEEYPCPTIQALDGNNET